jgi:hypothetical protein
MDENTSAKLFVLIWCQSISVYVALKLINEDWASFVFSFDGTRRNAAGAIDRA